MAVRKSINQIKSELQNKIFKGGEYWIEKQFADLGNYSGVVEVPNTQNMVYARLANGQVVEVFNNVAPNIYNWKVSIGRDKSQPSLVKVVEVRWVYNIRETIAYILFHHKQHEYPNPDTTWISRDNFLPLLVLPKSGFTVRLYGDVIYSSSMPYPVRVLDVDDLDVSSYVVSAGARYVLLEADSTGALNYVVGDTVTSREVLYTQPLPVPTLGSFPICAFIFYEGQTELRRDSVERTIIDLRMFTSDSSLNVAAQIHAATGKTTPVDADEFGLTDSVASWILKKVTWTNIKATLKIYFDTLYSALGHVHDAADVTYTPAVLADWDGSADPGDVDQALDQLAERMTTGGGGLPNPFALTADITPTPLSASVNDYDPTGLSTADIIRIDADDEPYSITGLVGGADGRIVIFHNVSNDWTIDFPKESTSSAAANRFDFPNSIRLRSKRTLVIQYDAAISRWRAIASDDAVSIQGVAINPGLASLLDVNETLVFDGEELVPAPFPTDESIQDIVGAMFSGNTETGITATYQDADGTIDLEVTGSGYPPGHLFGCELSNNGTDPTNDIDITAGNCRDSTNAVDMTIPARIKRLDASWVTGTNQGGLSSSLTIANITYHVFAIRVAGVDDVGFDTSVAAANLIADHSATHIRRLGSIIRVAGVILPFTQVGDYFELQTPVRDANDVAGELGTSSRTYTLASVPTGIVLRTNITGFTWKVANYAAVYVRALTQVDVAAAYNTNANVYDVSGGAGASSNLVVWTNTSAQIAARSNVTSTNLIIITRGWIDTRGR